MTKTHWLDQPKQDSWMGVVDCPTLNLRKPEQKVEQKPKQRRTRKPKSHQES